MLKKLLLIFIFTSASFFAENETSLFLPQDHPMRRKLDAIFKHEHCTANIDAFKKGDFYILHWSSGKHAVVARHPALKGYIVKTFLDSQQIGDGKDNLVKRAFGSRKIAAFLAENRFKHLFKVPEKWIYEIPGIKKGNQVRFLLIAKDMKPLPDHLNKKKWKSRSFDLKRLKAFYKTLKCLGLMDSVYIDNVPFCEDGKIAFLDTEHFNHPVIDFSILSKYLHPVNQILWTKITAQ